MTSGKTEDGGRKAEMLDAAIDDAVREMMHVEPRADLRARVIEQIERPRHGFRWTWMLAPVAAAVVLIVAIEWWQASVVPPVRTAATDIVLPASVTQPSATLARREEPRTAHAVAPGGPANRRIAAVVAADNTRFSVSSPPPGFAEVDALRPPPPITVNRISPAVPAETPQLEIPPLRVPALEVNALPDSPRERHDEE